MATNPPTAAPTTRSAAAERMRLHRERQRQGLRCNETEIDTLTQRGLLKPEMRNDLYEIREALHAHLDRPSAKSNARTRACRAALGRMVAEIGNFAAEQ